MTVKLNNVPEYKSKRRGRHREKQNFKEESRNESSGNKEKRPRNHINGADATKGAEKASVDYGVPNKTSLILTGATQKLNALEDNSHYETMDSRSLEDARIRPLTIKEEVNQEEISEVNPKPILKTKSQREQESTYNDNMNADEQDHLPTIPGFLKKPMGLSIWALLILAAAILSATISTVSKPETLPSTDRNTDVDGNNDSSVDTSSKITSSLDFSTTPLDSTRTSEATPDSTESPDTTSTPSTDSGYKTFPTDSPDDDDDIDNFLRLLRLRRSRKKSHKFSRRRTRFH